MVMREVQRRRGRALAHASLAIVTIAAHAAFAVAPWSALDGFPLDDSWIHQVVARTFASSGTLGYAPGMHGAGATSYLWAALLAFNFKFLHVSPVAFALCLNGVLAVVSLQLLYVLVADTLPRARRIAHEVAAASAVAVAACAANFVWFTFSGMEATLIAALSLGAIVAWSRPSASVRSAWVAGVGVGLLALSRPECIALGPMLALAFRWLGRPRRQLVALLAPWAGCLALYVGSNVLFAGSALPATLGGRRWLWADTSVGLSKLELAQEFAGQWLQRLRDYTLGTSVSVLFWLALGVVVFAAFDARVRRSRGLLLLVAWAVAHTGFYVLLLPTPGHGGRYQPLIPLLFALGIGLGSRAVLAGILARFRRVSFRREMASGLTLMACAGWIALLFVGIRDLGHDHVRAVSHIRATEQAAGLAIRDLPPGAKVASFDIGGTGYFADRPVHDIGGLSDAATVEHLRRGSIWEMLRDQGIGYVVLPVAYTDDYPDPVHFGHRLRLFENPAVHLEPIRSFVSSPRVWLAGAKAVQHSSPRQLLSRLIFTGLPGPEPLVTTAEFIEPVLAPELDVDERAVHQVRHGLALLAGAGVKVRLQLHVIEPLPLPEDDSLWVATLASNGVSLQPPKALGIDRRVATSLLAQRALPYLEERDFGGLLRLTTWTIAELIRTHHNPRFLPPLPSVEPPRYARAPNSVNATTEWGIPLALGVVAFFATTSSWSTLARRRLVSWLRARRGVA